MALECLILSCDPIVLVQLQTNLRTLGASTQIRRDATSALELASRRHLDGLIIDCDDTPQGIAALAQIRNTRANQQTCLLAVVNGSPRADAAISVGANFILDKPFDLTRLSSVLYVAVDKMKREHRRYFRYEVKLPVRIQNHFGQFFVADMRNVSQGGLAMKLAAPAKLEGLVIVEFDLPSIESRTFHAKAEVVWSDAFGAGLRFLSVNKDSSAAIQGWLNSLEAQAQLRRPDHRSS